MLNRFVCALSSALYSTSAALCAEVADWCALSPLALETSFARLMLVVIPMRLVVLSVVGGTLCAAAGLPLLHLAASTRGRRVHIESSLTAAKLLAAARPAVRSSRRRRTEVLLGMIVVRSCCRAVDFVEIDCSRRVIVLVLDTRVPSARYAAAFVMAAVARGPLLRPLAFLLIQA